MIELRGTKGRCPKTEYKWDCDTRAWFCKNTGEPCALESLDTPCLFYEQWTPDEGEGE